MAWARSPGRLHIGQWPVGRSTTSRCSRFATSANMGWPGSGQLQHLRARDRAAHQGGPDRAAGVVGELDGLTKHGAGLRDGPGPKPLEDLCAQAFEARLLGEDVEGRQRKLLQLLREVWGEDASRRHRAGVDPHHPVDKLRVSVQDEADGSVRPTVGDDESRADPRRPRVERRRPGSLRLDRRGSSSHAQGRPRRDRAASSRLHESGRCSGVQGLHPTPKRPASGRR